MIRVLGPPARGAAAQPGGAPLLDALAVGDTRRGPGGHRVDAEQRFERRRLGRAGRGIRQPPGGIRVSMTANDEREHERERGDGRQRPEPGEMRGRSHEDL